MKDVRTKLETVYANNDSISHALEFIFQACDCTTSPEILKNAFESVRVAHAALVQNQSMLESIIAQLTREA